MLFKYKSIDSQGVKKSGEIDSANRDSAISALQHKGLIVISIKGENELPGFLRFFVKRVSDKDMVLFSRQIATLFESQVSPLKIFSMLSTSAKNEFFGYKLSQISNDIQNGLPISAALSKHPDLFQDFYVNMVKTGEETGKLNKVFSYLADYLDRQYLLTSKAKNALIYPIFVIITFVIVMSLMLGLVIPKLSVIIEESAQEIPIYTKIIIALSGLFVSYGWLLIIFLAIFGIFLWYLSRTDRGQIYLATTSLSVPYIGQLYRTLYLSRIADNLNTMFVSGVQVVRSIDITSEVVGNIVYRDILKKIAESVKSGILLSTAFQKFPRDIPPVMIQMIAVGEETGSLGPVLKTLADFYSRELNDSIETLVGMIEPAMIIILGFGVGILLTSVLIPIYNIASGIS